MLSHWWMLLGVLALSFSTVGCRRVYTFVPLEGTITKAGQPLGGVRVIFFADPDSGTTAPRSVGRTDDAGHYRLRTDNGDDGAVVGQYRVCIVESLSQREDSLRSILQDSTSTSKLSAATTSSRNRKERKIPAIYGQVYETPLRANVRPGSIQIFDFNIP